MKKVIILAIVLIFLASIFIVNFFGLEIAIFDGTTYVNAVELDSLTVFRQNGDEVVPELKGNYPGTAEPYFVFDFIPPPEGVEYDEENIALNENQLFISRIVHPTDADTKSTRFEYDEAYNDFAVFIEEKNTIVFLKPKKLMHITIRAIDGSNIATSFYIMAREAKNAK